HLNSSLVCGFHFFLTKIFDQLSPWLLVFLACNRLFLTKFPRSYKTSKTALLTTLSLLIFLIILNLHLLFGIGLGYSLSSPCL
ncbi:unnamed protein product, partial [Didymodactylos carnosus]